MDDYTKAIEIAKDVYWVGVYVKDDTFQCHTYLVVDGDESVLIDPGSMLEFEEVKKKVESIIDIKDVKYLIAHHQDPDVCANLPAFERAIDRDDLEIVSHSRNFALIKHYGISSKFYTIEDHHFCLKTKRYDFEFLTTPYAHAPGAFVTYLKDQKVLFSSDIFGGLEESWHLYADENYFKEIRLFHENYMPSQDILNYSLEKIEALELEFIAPQHGSIIQKHYIQKVIDELKELKCGLYIDKEYVTSLIEQKEKEELTNKKLNLVLDSLDNIIVISTDGRKLKYINAAFFRFSAFKNFEEFKQKHHCICELFEPMGGENYLQPKYEDGSTWIDKLIKEPHKNFMAVMKNRDGINTLFQVSAKEIDYKEYLVSFLDITIYQKNMNFMKILSNIHGVYFSVTNLNGEIEFVSDSLLRELNLKDFKPKKFTISDFLNKEDHQQALEHIKNNDSTPYEITIVYDDIKIPVLTYGYFGIIDHKPVRITVLIDLREIKKYQEEAKEQELLLMQQSKMAQMGEMVSMIAHQWRQPLNAISAASIQATLKYEMDMLDKEAFMKSQSFIQQECQKMSKVIDTFMNYSKNTQKVSEFVFDEVIEQIDDLIAPMLKSKGIALHFDTSEKLNLYGNANMLEQILLNLIVNARDAFIEHPEIEDKEIKICTTKEQSIEVIDNAGGIPEEMQERIFLPYFTTKEPGKGTGLGLYMSRRIMQEHFKGDLSYERVANGSKFVLHFTPLPRGGGKRWR